MTRKILSCILAMTMLFACGSFSLAEGEGTPTIKMTAVLHPNTQNPAELPIYQQISEKTGVNVEWTCYTSNDWAEKKNLMFASGDLPDAFFGRYALGASDIQANSEYFVALEDLINENCPNIQSMYAEYPDAARVNVYADGHTYAVGHVMPARPSTYGAMYINQAWLDKLSLATPTTIDELTDVLRAFRDGGDLNGDGEANEIPFTISDLESVNFGSRLFLGSFGVYDSIDSYLALDGEGHVVYNPVQEGYRKYLNWMNTLYSENLLDSEAFTHDFAGFKAKTRLTENEIVGLQVCWSLDTIGNDNYTMLLPVTGPDGDRMISANSTYNKLGTSNYNCFEITIANPDPAATMRWLDELYSDEYGIQAYYGAYDSALGVNEDGAIYQLDPPEGYSLNSWCWTVGMNDNFVGYVSKAVEDKLVFNDVYSATGRSKLDDDARYLPYTDESRNFPNVTLTESENEEIALLKTDIDSIRSEYAARWVVEGGIDDQWDAYVAQLNDAGLSRYLEIYQAAYDRLNG